MTNGEGAKLTFSLSLQPSVLRKRFPMVLESMKGWHTSALEQQIAPLIAAGEIR